MEWGSATSFTAKLRTRSRLLPPGSPLKPFPLVALLILLSPALAAVGAHAPAERLVVAFHDAPAALAVGDGFLGARVVHVNPTLRFAIVEAQDAAAFERRALAEPGVVGVSPDVWDMSADALPGAWVNPSTDPTFPPAFLELPAAATPLSPNDTYYAAQYGLPQVRVDQVWPAQRDAPDVVLCVLDTGVRATHEDLVGDRWKGGYDFVERDDDPQDPRYHGTFVTSVAAGNIDNGRGVAGIAQVAFYHGRVLDDKGRGATTVTSEGIQWCADLPEERVVISMSWSGRFSDTDAGRTLQQIQQDAVQYAASKGRLLVGSAGNENGRSPGCLDCVNYPARWPEVIAVTGTGRGETFAWWSSAGPQAEISAPGEWVPGAVHKSDRAYGVWSGTSFAAPLVSGAAALVWSANPDLTAADVRARLAATTQDLGTPGRDSLYGHGELDVRCLMANTTPCDGRT